MNHRQINAASFRSGSNPNRTKDERLNDPTPPSHNVIEKLNHLSRRANERQALEALINQFGCSNPSLARRFLLLILTLDFLSVVGAVSGQGADDQNDDQVELPAGGNRAQRRAINAIKRKNENQAATRPLPGQQSQSQQFRVQSPGAQVTGNQAASPSHGNNRRERRANQFAQTQRQNQQQQVLDQAADAQVAGDQSGGVQVDDTQATLPHPLLEPQSLDNPFENQPALADNTLRSALEPVEANDSEEQIKQICSTTDLSTSETAKYEARQTPVIPTLQELISKCVNSPGPGDGTTGSIPQLEWNVLQGIAEKLGLEMRMTANRQSSSKEIYGTTLEATEQAAVRVLPLLKPGEAIMVIRAQLALADKQLGSFYFSVRINKEKFFGGEGFTSPEEEKKFREKFSGPFQDGIARFNMGDNEEERATNTKRFMERIKASVGTIAICDPTTQTYCPLDDCSPTRIKYFYLLQFEDVKVFDMKTREDVSERTKCINEEVNKRILSANAQFKSAGKQPPPAELIIAEISNQETMHANQEVMHDIL
jgi:hypothetical protein